MRNKKNGSRYALFERKIFYSFIGVGAVCVLLVFMTRSMVRGRLGNMIVRVFQNWLYMDYEHAYKAYDLLIRSNLTAIVIGTVLVLLLIAFRLLLKWITRYFDEINSGLDILIGQNGDNVQLSGEMWSMEDKMNQCKEILQKRDQDAKLAEQRKNDLVVYLAHDIKTPLTSVIGYLDLLEQHPEMSLENRIKYTGLAVEKANRLEELLQEMFEVTRYNVQEIRLEYRECDISFMLCQMADEFYPQLLRKGQEIKVSCKAGLCIAADPDKLARVFHNILKNAISYGAEGSTIEIQGDLHSKELVLVFRNEGRAVSGEELNRLFDKFYRSDWSRGTADGNAGLGLAIAREIVEAHGGHIYAESMQHIIEFHVHLPYSVTKM